ncbi:hypothetical protein B0H19DRAFT_1075980 [Mycena capillaripes]|nr:hypothetical protein B0H19DRAFT_1075906 [Mycena capillaripes]KAJ6545713.1 hypothetical protein B0H19DRAFT_1075980 [Mycena capillaripes]
MPEGFEKDSTANLHPVHGLGPVNITADAWTSRASTTLYVASVHRPEAWGQNSIHTLRPIPTRCMSGMRFLVHLVNLRAQAQDYHLKTGAISPTEDHPQTD